MSRMSEFAGRSGAEYTMAVERGKIREFAAAVGSDHPAYFGDEPVSPPTFLASNAFWTTDGSDPWGDQGPDLSRVLHAGQRYVFHGPPPRAGAVLQCRQRIDRVYTKQGRRGGALEFADIVTEYRDADGELVAESIATLVVTEQAPQ
ncbi:FAS1-like dehydratase domain-containing protein [Dactylosporangium vinaceum]|uniref:MaoC family dehydratase N-terminal domain-containing protein n=1 Tax=Dactylosporangium vinaceum TaxID=53362 RepID=A0ABV5MGG5_9ACTN|nr:MaoC family dehydratase N-terminal domain-containing protein [Dactylosporangium vinaceum]